MAERSACAHNSCAGSRCGARLSSHAQPFAISAVVILPATGVMGTQLGLGTGAHHSWAQPLWASLVVDTSLAPRIVCVYIISQVWDLGPQLQQLADAAEDAQDSQQRVHVKPLHR